MFNDISCGTKDNEEECLANARLVSLYAQRFGKGQWSFIGPGFEKKWHTISEDSPQGIWDKIADRMMLEFAESGCPNFRATTPLSRGQFRSKGHGKLSIHYAADQESIETIFRIIVSANQLSLYEAVAEICEEHESLHERTERPDMVMGQSIVLNKLVTNLNNNEQETWFCTKTRTSRFFHKNNTFWGKFGPMLNRRIFNLRLCSVEEINSSSLSWKTTSRKWWSNWILENQRQSLRTFLVLSSLVWRQVEENHGRRSRKQEKIPVLYWFVMSNLVPPSSPRSFRTQSHWSFATGQCTGQCCYSGRFLPIHWSCRMCNQFTFHHQVGIDTWRFKFEQQTDSILSACGSHGQKSNTIERYHSSRNTSSLLYAGCCKDGNWRSHIRESICVTSASSKNLLETWLDQRIGFSSCSTTRWTSRSTVSRFPIEPTKSKPRSW